MWINIPHALLSEISKLNLKTIKYVFTFLYQYLNYFTFLKSVVFCFVFLMQIL